MTNGNQVETKEGTQSTPVKIRVSLSLIVPIWVTNVVSPVGKWATVLMTKVMVVRWGIEWTIWSVAPVSKIQSLDAKACLSTILAEKMECLESMPEGVEGKMISPVKLLTTWGEVASPDWSWAPEFTIADS